LTDSRRWRTWPIWRLNSTTREEGQVVYDGCAFVGPVGKYDAAMVDVLHSCIEVGVCIVPCFFFFLCGWMFTPEVSNGPMTKFMIFF